MRLQKVRLKVYRFRVTRGHKHNSEYSPDSGYQYSGLYHVEDYWKEKGKAGFVIWRYRLVAHDIVALDREVKEPTGEYDSPKRKTAISSRVVRDYQKALNVKQWYNYECQICGFAIQTTAGLYAEAAHIMPLGEPHNGPDSEHKHLMFVPQPPRDV